MTGGEPKALQIYWKFRNLYKSMTSPLSSYFYLHFIPFLSTFAKIRLLIYVFQ